MYILYVIYRRLPATVKGCRAFYFAAILIYALVYAYNIKVRLIYLTSIYFTHLMTGNPLASVPHSFAVYIRHVQTLQPRAYQKHRRARMATTPPHMYVCHLPLTKA